MLHERDRIVQGAFDIALLAIGVPCLQTLDKGLNDVVQRGVERGLLIGEVVVEERAGASHALGDGRDGEPAHALLGACVPNRRENLLAPVVVGMALVTS